MERPWWKFFGRDWLDDRELENCSLAAQGLWIAMLCLMNEGVPYGYLQDRRGPISPTKLAVRRNITLVACNRLIAELETNSVFSRTDTGVIYSRRMVRDEDLRAKRAAAGAKGGDVAQQLLKQNAKAIAQARSDSGFSSGFENKKNQDAPTIDIFRRFEIVKSRHPGAVSRANDCRAAYQNLLVNSTDPINTADAIDRIHEAWIAYWVGSGSLPLGLLNYLVGGDCLTEPPPIPIKKPTTMTEKLAASKAIIGQYVSKEKL